MKKWKRRRNKNGNMGRIIYRAIGRRKCGEMKNKEDL